MAFWSTDYSTFLQVFTVDDEMPAVGKLCPLCGRGL